MRYDDRVRSVTVIHRYQDGDIKPWGNGIFVEFEGHPYLVTCRHIVRSDLANSEGNFDLPEELILKLKSPSTKIFHNYEVKILGPRRWRTSPTLNASADVAIIELPDKLLQEYDVVPWIAADLRIELQPEIGTDIWIFLHQDDREQNPVFYDVRASMGSLQNDGRVRMEDAVANFSFGDSGSLVYRFNDGAGSKTEAIDDRCIQVVGIVVGAPKVIRSSPEMELITRAIPLFASTTDFLDEDGVGIINP